MGDVLKYLLLAAVVVGVIWFMWHDLRRGGADAAETEATEAIATEPTATEPTEPDAKPAKTKPVIRLPRYISGAATGGFVTGFIATMAIIALTRSFLPTLLESGVALAGGVFFAVFATPAFLGLRLIVLAVVAILGSIPTFLQLDNVGMCIGLDSGQHVWLGAVLAAVAIGAAVWRGFVAGTPKLRWATLVGTGWRRWLVLPAGIFVGLQFILFLATPLSGSFAMSSNPAMSTSLALLGAVAFGLAAGFVPGLALLLGGLAIVVSQALVGATWGSLCLPAQGVGVVVPLVVFVVAYVVVGLILDPFRRAAHPDRPESQDAEKGTPNG